MAAQAKGADQAATTQNALSTSSESVLAANINRRSAILQNLDGTDAIFISTTNPATSGNSFRLGTGESMPVTFRGELFGIAAANTPTLAIYEEKD